MSTNPVASKIAAPYARALFDFSVDKNIMHKITADFQNLSVFFAESSSSELTEYLNNPVVSQEAKREILIKALKAELNTETFKFLMVLVERDRINLLEAVVAKYLELVFEAASIKTIEVQTAFDFTSEQRGILVEKLRKLTDARDVKLVIKVDPSLIGGFLIKTESKVINFTIKNQLQQLAKHLDTILEI